MASKEKNKVNNPPDKPIIPTLETKIPKTIHALTIKDSLPAGIKEHIAAPIPIEKT